MVIQMIHVLATSWVCLLLSSKILLKLEELKSSFHVNTNLHFIHFTMPVHVHDEGHQVQHASPPGHHCNKGMPTSQEPTYLACLILTPYLCFSSGNTFLILVKLLNLVRHMTFI